MAEYDFSQASEQPAGVTTAALDLGSDLGEQGPCCIRAIACFEAAARKDEREKVLSEVERWVGSYDEPEMSVGSMQANLFRLINRLREGASRG